MKHIQHKSLLLLAAFLSGCSGHPSSLVGVWNVSTNVTVSFMEDGQVRLNGAGSAPAFLAALHNLGTWRASPGSLKLTTHDPGAAPATHKYSYTIDSQSGDLKINDNGNNWEFTPARK